MFKRELKTAFMALCIAVLLYASACNVRTYAAIKGGEKYNPPASPVSNQLNSQKASIPELVKTKSYKVADILNEALGRKSYRIPDSSILQVQVIPIGGSKGFAYFDGFTTWKLRYGAEKPEDIDNSAEDNCWKIIGGMTEQEKRAELDPLDEGGAGLGASGAGAIDIKVYYRNDEGGISIETVRANVILKKLIIEVDWMEGSFDYAVEKGRNQKIAFKPNINKEFIDTFGQAGISVEIKDTPEKGNKHNIIPKNALFAGNLMLNRGNLAELLPGKYQGWRGNIKLFNEGISCIAKGIIDKGYMDFDASRPDVIYVIGAQRWSCMPGDEIEQTRGATAIFERNGKQYNVAFVFNRAIAESTAAINSGQEMQVPWKAASLHTVLHECAAHCFPIHWKNSSTQLALDNYWNGWRYLFVGHTKRNELHEYGRIYKTCVTTSESTLDAAYHTWLGEPRLTDFSNAIGNSTADKCRDIIRDYIVEGEPRKYGRNNTEKRVVNDGNTSSLSFSHH